MLTYKKATGSTTVCSHNGEPLNFSKKKKRDLMEGSSGHSWKKIKYKENV